MNTHNKHYRVVSGNQIHDNNKKPYLENIDVIKNLPKYVSKSVGDKMFIPKLGSTGMIMSWCQFDSTKITYFIKPEFSNTLFGTIVNLRSRT